MRFLDKIENIKAELINTGNTNIAEDILELQLSGGTGGEVLGLVCSKLIELKHMQSGIYDLISQPAEELMEYSKSLGMHPHWNQRT